MGSSARAGVNAVQKKIDEERRKGKTAEEILAAVEKEIVEIADADADGWF